MFLEGKDVIGPIISLGGAALSGVLLFKNYSLTRRNSDRNIYVEGQKFLMDVCKQLMANPELWCIYDDEAMQRDPSINKPDSLFQAKTRAFAHFHLNIFEIVLAELPPIRTDSSLSAIWFRYSDDTISKSTAIRAVRSRIRTATRYGAPEYCGNMRCGGKSSGQGRRWATEMADKRKIITKLWAAGF